MKMKKRNQLLSPRKRSKILLNNHHQMSQNFPKRQMSYLKRRRKDQRVKLLIRNKNLRKFQRKKLRNLRKAARKSPRRKLLLLMKSSKRKKVNHQRRNQRKRNRSKKKQQLLRTRNPLKIRRSLKRRSDYFI